MSDKPRKPIVVLYPPKIILGPLTDKYREQVIVRWGDKQSELLINREHGNTFHIMCEQITKTLLDLSELQPYEIK